MIVYLCKLFVLGDKGTQVSKNDFMINDNDIHLKDVVKTKASKFLSKNEAPALVTIHPVRILGIGIGRLCDEIKYRYSDAIPEEKQSTVSKKIKSLNFFDDVYI